MGDDKDKPEKPKGNGHHASPRVSLHPLTVEEVTKPCLEMLPPEKIRTKDQPKR